MKTKLINILLLLAFTATAQAGMETNYVLTCKPKDADISKYSVKTNLSDSSTQIIDGEAVQFMGAWVTVNDSETFFDPDAGMFMRGIRAEGIVSAHFSYQGKKGFLTRNCSTGDTLDCPQIVDPITNEVIDAECTPEITFGSATQGARSAFPHQGKGFLGIELTKKTCISTDNKMIVEISELYKGIVLTRRLHQVTINNETWFSSFLGKVLPGEPVTIGEEMTAQGFSDRVEVVLDGQIKYTADCVN